MVLDGVDFVHVDMAIKNVDSLGFYLARITRIRNFLFLAVVVLCRVMIRDRSGSNTKRTVTLLNYADGSGMAVGTVMVGGFATIRNILKNKQMYSV